MGRTFLYLCFSGECLVGLLSVRPELSAAYRNTYGDIGYGVRPSRRKEGIAKEMLSCGLQVCREHGLTDVILGCYKDNIASRKTILANGGQFLCECVAYERGHLSQYFRIEL